MKKSLSSKVFLSLFAIIIIIIILFAFTFSPLGNYFIAKALLSQLQERTQMQWKSNSFHLTPNKIALDFSTDNNSLNLSIQGDYSLFFNHLKGEFSLHSNHAKIPFKNTSLSLGKNQWIRGNFSGKFNDYSLQASSNFAQSQSDIIATFSYLSPQTLAFNVENAQLADLLESFEEKQYASGTITLHTSLNFQDQTNGKLYANIQGKLDQNLFLSDFYLKIPNTTFNGDFQASLSQNAITYNLKTNSTLGNISFNGTTNIHSFATNTDFLISLTNISPLSPFLKIPLNGSFEIQGIAKGDFKNMLLNGEMQLSNSPLNYHLSLQEFKPKTLKITSKNFKANSLFLLFDQIPFFEGDVEVDMDLRDFSQGISGVITLNSKNLFINSPILEEKTQIGFPYTRFSLASKLDLSNGKGLVDYTLQSDLLKLEVKSGKFTLHPLTFEFPTTFEVSKLQNLSYRSKTALLGSLKAQGIHTNNSFELQGAIDYDNKQNPFLLMLTPQNFTLRIQQIPSSQVYRLFDKIPRYFEGVGNFNLNNDLINHINNINFDIHQLRFQNTPLLLELENTSKQKLSQETFSGYIYSTILQNENLQSRIQLQSKNLKIQSSKIVTNLNTSKVEGDFILNHHNNETKYTISGSVSKPKIQNSH